MTPMAVLAFWLVAMTGRHKGIQWRVSSSDAADLVLVRRLGAERHSVGEEALR